MKSKIVLLTFFTGFLSIMTYAQAPEEEVKQVITSLFEGMRAKDTQQVANAFSSEALMQTVIIKPEGNSIGSNAVSDFVKRIESTPAEIHLDERILDYQVKVDGILASAWTPYRFYVNEKFSHCGVNSFQLVKMSEGWKIVYIIDTRRKEDCE